MTKTAHEPFVPQPKGGPHLYEIGDLERQLEGAKGAYLKRWGWTQTCNSPGSFWVWYRDFADYDQKMAAVHKERKLPSDHRPYGIITAPTDLAISMTRSALDEQLELGEDD